MIAIILTFFFLLFLGVGVMTWWWAVLVALGAAPLWPAAAQGRPPGKL